MKKIVEMKEIIKEQEEEWKRDNKLEKERLEVKVVEIIKRNKVVRGKIDDN